MARVIVSAGHTNNDPGTIAEGLKEVELNRAIARKVVAQLRANGIITLSVPPNMDLQKRIDWINGTGYSSEFDDLAIEIHINDGGKSGFEFWHEDKNDASKKLGDTIMDKVIARTGVKSQGVKSEAEHEFKNLAFLNKTNTTSLLLECLYIDNAEDAKKLKEDTELNKIAKGIAEGICTHLNIEYIETEMPQNNQATNAVKKETPQTTVPANNQRNIANQPQQPVNNNFNSPMNNPQMQNPGGFNRGFDDFPKPQNNFQSYDSFNTPSNGSYQQQGGFNNNQPQMSREERKEMISKLYQKILGREPNQNDLNYFLNIGITEDKLIKRMVESQEHFDLINIKKDYELNKEIYEKQKIELSRLKAENNDQKVLLHNLSKLLHQKNRHISEMRVRLDKYEPVHGSKKKEMEEKVEYKGKFSDKVFHFLSSFLG